MSLFVVFLHNLNFVVSLSLCNHSKQCILYLKAAINEDEMSSDPKTEDVLIQIRSKLQEDRVKLWLPPYYTESTGICEEELAVSSFFVGFY